MDELIRNIGNSILDTKTLAELERLKHRLETQPFCGLQRCYDLEHFVFHVIKPFQRDAVIEHIRSLSSTAKPRPHIFIDFDYYQLIGKRLDSLDIHWITILTSKDEYMESTNRYKTHSKNAMISGLPQLIYNGVIQRDSLEFDHKAELVASNYINSIINYMYLFPNIIPIWISRLNPASIILAKKLEKRAQNPRSNFKWLGAYLGVQPSQNIDKDYLASMNIITFKNNRELIEGLSRVFDNE